MEIEILEKKESPLLSRIEVSFRIKHPKESTPKRNEIRDGIAAQINVKKNCVVIDNMKPVFGKAETIGFAKIYSSDKDARDFERKHILKRNKLETVESKKGVDKTTDTEVKKEEASPEPTNAEKQTKDE